MPEPERPTSESSSPRLDGERHVAQDRLRAVALADGLEADHAGVISRVRARAT